MIAMQVLWDENVGSNDDYDENNKNVERIESHESENRWEALEELKERNVLSIGLIESFFQATLNIFLFAWTPILTSSSSSGQINVGYTFCCFILTMILGTNMFEVIPF